MISFRFLADENLHGGIVRGHMARLPTLDLVRACDVGIEGQPDPMVLAWAGERGRIVLSHDAATMPFFVHQRIARDEPMPGLFVVGHAFGLGQIIDEIVYICTESDPSEWGDAVTYFRSRQSG